MKNIAAEIVTEVKSRGKEVLSNVTEFLEVKQKLENIRDNMFVKIDSSVLKGPWKWQKKVYQSLEHYIDVAIDKLDSIEMNDHEQIKDSVRDYNSGPTVSGYGTVPMVSEEKYEYGAEAFEAFMAKRENTESAADMTQRDVRKTDKSR